MSNLFALPSLELLLIAGRAVVLVAAFAMFGWGFLRWRRAAQCDTQRVFEQLDLVRADLLIMKEAMNKTAHRVDTAAQRIAHDARIAPPPVAAGGRGYEIAARLARNGANKEAIIKSCGVTAHEAELLVKLHGRAQTVAQSAVGDRTAQAAAASNAAAVGKQIRLQQQAAAPSQPTSRAPQSMRSRLVAVG